MSYLIWQNHLKKELWLEEAAWLPPINWFYACNHLLEKLRSQNRDNADVIARSLWSKDDSFEGLMLNDYDDDDFGENAALRFVAEHLRHHSRNLVVLKWERMTVIPYVWCHLKSRKKVNIGMYIHLFEKICILIKVQKYFVVNEIPKDSIVLVISSIIWYINLWRLSTIY